MNSPTTLEQPQAERVGTFHTSSVDLTDLESIVVKMESYASSDPQTSPADIMKRAQEERSRITKKCTRDKIFDDAGLFEQLNILHVRLIHASIEARVHWAQIAVAGFVEQVRTGQIPYLQERKEEKSVWWLDGKSDHGNETERAYESAATVVQGLPEKDQKRFEGVISKLRSSLRRIHVVAPTKS